MGAERECQYDITIFATKLMDSEVITDIHTHTQQTKSFFEVSSFQETKIKLLGKFIIRSTYGDEM
jgi:hypothetical protein